MTHHAQISLDSSPSRRFVAAVAAVLFAIVWTHGLAAVLRPLSATDADPAALALTLAALATTAIGCALLPRRGSVLAAAAASMAGALAIAAFTGEAFTATLALPVVTTLATAGARWLGERLPQQLDVVVSRRRALAVAWAVLALLAVVQTGRLATSMTDRDIGFFLTTEHPFWYGHECIGAYLHGAELAGRGEENLYDASHFPALDATAEPITRLEHVTLEDPYQYPPQFLVLPQLALAFTHDVSILRVFWFALQVTLFVVVAAWLALFVRGRAGQAALWALPAVFVSFPALHNFYFGQFHLPAVALAIGAMLAFARRWNVAGGAMLAFAILSKIFPLALLALLAGEKRFRACAWTLAFVAAFSVLALATLGPQPFVAFIEYQMPRLADGSAFAFEDAWPELADLVVLDNQGVYGLALKLGVGKGVASVAGRLFGALTLLLALVVGLIGRRRSRRTMAASWLGLLGLASLASPGAWGDYVPVTAVWLLTLFASTLASGSLPARTALLTAFAFEALVLGTMPLGNWMPLGLMTPLSAAGVAIMLALFGWTIAARFERPALLRSARVPRLAYLQEDGRGDSA